jgi:hypothetical protein
MKNLILRVYKPGKIEKPETTITLPLSTLHISMQLLPKKIKSTLEKEGIDLSQCSELVEERGIKGTLIEIENPAERLVISVE